jgi:hypothetical protein
MSYQLDLQKNPDAKPEIEMPPLSQENASIMSENQVENGQDVVENEITLAQASSEEVSPGLQALQEVAEEPVQEAPKKVGPQESFSRLRKERDEALRRVQEYETMTARFQQQPQVQQQEPDIELNVNSDDLVEGKHLKAYAKKIQQLEQKLQQTQQQTQSQMAQQLLRSKFNDFDRVVTEDNIERLRYDYPELANTLNSSNDLYSTGVSAYTMIKNLGIIEQPQERVYMADKAQAQKNLAKPKPLASISPQQGDTPLSKANAFANGFTDEVRKQMLKEMNDARKSL